MERTRPRGFWQSVTGSLAWGERAADAASRELREETGLRAAQGRLIDLHRGESFPIIPPWRARYAPQVRFNRERWFLYELPGRRTIRLNPAEHRQYRWLSVDQAMQRATSWTNRKAIRQLLDGRFRFRQRA